MRKQICHGSKVSVNRKKMIYNVKSCNLFLSLFVLEAKEVKHMDSGKDIREAVIKYSNTLYKVCIVILCNEQDVQDAIQDTFCRYLEKKPVFRDEEHEKAWLIRVATNICRDMIRFRVRHTPIRKKTVWPSCSSPIRRKPQSLRRW